MTRRGATLLGTAWQSLHHRCNCLQSIRWAVYALACARDAHSTSYLRASSSTASTPPGIHTNPADLSVASSKLFDKVPPIPPEAAAAAAAAAEPPAPSRIWSIISNTIFGSFVASACLVGYYQYAYDTDQLQTIVEETRKPENSFPGSEVRRTTCGDVHVLHHPRRRGRWRCAGT